MSLRLSLAQCLIGAGLFALSCCATAAADKPPHIVFILVDDMGYGDPGCYNADSKIPTPHIDSLARDGMRFTDAHAAGPLCHMSRYGLLTGKYPFRVDVTRWPTHALIQPEQMTIASLLRSQGYRTHMVGKWHLGFNEQGYDRPLPGGPVDVGFDSFFGIRASTDIPPYFYIRDDRAVASPSDSIAASNSPGWTKIQGKFWRAGGIAPRLDLADVLPDFTEEAIQVIEHHPVDAEPLMLYLAFPAPHTPWLPADEFVGKSKADMYGDFMVMVDAMIGRVLQSIDDANMTDETMVIFSSDNGPTWYPADLQRFGHDSAGGFRGMKADAWEAGHRVPFIVRWPGNVAPGGRSSRLISFVDLLATFAELNDVKLEHDDGVDSLSFLDALTNGAPKSKPRESIALRSGSGHMTFRSGPWKLIDQLGSGGFTKPSRIAPQPGEPVGQLYHLDNDPDESENLYHKHPDVVDRLMMEMQQIVDAGRSR